MPVVAVIAISALLLGGVMFVWILVKAERGMNRDKDAMQIGPYNVWQPPPPSQPFPKAGDSDDKPS